MKDQDLTTPEPSNVIQLGPMKKTSVRPADPAIIKPATHNSAPVAEPDLMLAPYPDGVLFKCSFKPGASNGAFPIHDGAGTIVAACRNMDIANLFCEALHIYFQAARQNAEAQADAAKKVEDTINTPAKAKEDGK